MIAAVREDVKNLLQGNNDGHGFDHVERVYELSMVLAEKEKANLNVVGLAALLHDVDDYKLFGTDAAENLTNAKRILAENDVDTVTSEQVCDIIRSMGYNKALRGVRPQTLEGKVVSDADMLEAIGAMGTVRCLAYALARCHSGTHQIFDKTVWPEVNLSSEEYKAPNRKSDNFINHFFEKLLKLKNMMLTTSGREEALVRHEFMLVFLREFFRENNCPEWLEYLREYGKKY